MILASTALASLVSALVLVVPIEVVLAAAAPVSDVPLWLLALIAALTHVLGKLVHYAIGAGALRGAWFARQRAEPNAEWHERYARARAWCESHGWGPFALMMVSAATSLPPYAPMPFLAPAAGMRWPSFALASLLGRSIRFYAVVALTGWLPHWLIGL
ncbi:MAG: VTT domain-containing protein [Bowdeniella nasicola]|nr:VTT domain-containing protein [Bowdeniella nasicola]